MASRTTAVAEGGNHGGERPAGDESGRPVRGWPGAASSTPDSRWAVTEMTRLMKAAAMMPSAMMPGT